MQIEKPTVIQSYVWESVLRGVDVAYVAGARTGKTLGNLDTLVGYNFSKTNFTH